MRASRLAAWPRQLAAAVALVLVLSCAGCFTAMLWNPHEFGRGVLDAHTTARGTVDDGLTVPITAAVRDALGETLPPAAASAATAALRFEPRAGAPTSVAALLASAPASTRPVLQLYVATDRTMTGVLQAGTGAVPGPVESLPSLPSLPAAEATAAGTTEVDLDLAATRRFQPSGSGTRALVTPLTVALDVITSPIQLLLVLFRGL